MSPLVYANPDGRLIRLGDGTELGYWSGEFVAGETVPTLAAGPGKAGPRTAPTQVHEGNLTATSDTVYEGLTITGWFSFGNASNVTIRDCVILGGPDQNPTQSGNWPCVRAWGTGTNRRIEFCEIAPSHPGARVYGIHGWNFTAHRCWLHDCVDSFVTAQGNTLIEGCYIEKSRWYATDPNQTDGTHNDLCQAEGGSNHVLRGNVFDAGPGPDASRSNGGYGANFAILGTQNNALHTGTVIDRNWFRGTPYSHIQLGDSGDGAWPSLTITGNRFQDLSRNACMRMSPETLAAATIAGNTGPDGDALSGAQIQGATSQR